MNYETKSIILLIIGIGSFMFAALVIVLSPFIFGSNDICCVKYSDGKLTILFGDYFPDDPNLIKSIKWLLSKGYNLDSVSFDHVRGVWVFMTR